MFCNKGIQTGLETRRGRRLYDFRESRHLLNGMLKISAPPPKEQMSQGDCRWRGRKASSRRCDGPAEVPRPPEAVNCFPGGTASWFSESGFLCVHQGQWMRLTACGLEAWPN